MNDNKNTIPAVEKTVAILNILSNSSGGVTQTELVKRLGVTQSTAYRILQSLLKYNWVRKTQSNTYELANGILPMLLKLHNSEPYWENAQPILDRLAVASRLSCKLSVRRGSEQLTLIRADSPDPYGVSGKTGVSFPVIEGSVGAALLSRTPLNEIGELVSECNEDIEEKRNPKLIYDAVQTLKKQGYIYAEKSRWNICAMSCPAIGSDNTVVAAFTLLGLPEDFRDEKRPALIANLNEAVRTFTAHVNNIQSQDIRNILK